MHAKRKDFFETLSDVHSLHDMVYPMSKFVCFRIQKNSSDILLYICVYNWNLDSRHNQSNSINISTFPAATSVLSDIVPTIGCVHSSIVLHRYILTNILRSPLAFFETTPVGRILSRFSKDVDVVDNALPRQLTTFLGCLFKVSNRCLVS